MKTASTSLLSRRGNTRSLSAGWRPTFLPHRPSLAINDDSDLIPEVSVGEKYGARILAMIAVSFTLLTLVVVSTWLMLVSTISATPRVDNNILLVQRAAWNTGQAPMGEFAFAVPNAATSAGARIGEAVRGYPEGRVVQIAAQPGTDRMIADNGNLVVGNLDLGIRAPKALPGTYADYLGVCIAGSCVPGEVVALSPADVVGKVSGVLGSDGFRDLTRTQ